MFSEPLFLFSKDPDGQRAQGKKLIGRERDQQKKREKEITESKAVEMANDGDGPKQRERRRNSIRFN